MITQENKAKLPKRNGDKAIDKFLGAASEAAPVEPPAPWVQAEAVKIGIQGKDGFRAMHNMSVLGISREYRRRFAALGEQVFCEVVFSLRTIMWCRLKADFPGCLVTMEIVQPSGDLCVTVDKSPGHEYLSNPRVLQARLDDACAKLADCLGV